MSIRMRIIIGISGLAGLIVMLIIDRMLKSDGQFSTTANVIQIVSGVVTLVALIWDFIVIVGRCIYIFGYTIRVNIKWVLLVKGSSLKSQPMAVAFLERYTQEESNDISGKSQKDKCFIVTNFVAYSRFVSAVVHAACKKCPDDEEVICFTTLTMPLTKWFNFSEDKNLDFKYCRAHTEWEKYTNYLRELTYYAGTNKIPTVTIRRCILAVEDDFTKNLKDPDFAFTGHTEMQKHLNYWILVPANDINKLKPIEKSQIIDWFNKDLKFLEKDIGFYINSDSAYLILPDDYSNRGNSLPAPSGYKWSRLGRVFMRLFHSHLPTVNARYTIFKADEWSSCFDRNLSGIQKIPEDLFIIGFRSKGTDSLPEWVFCLAGNVDSKLDKLTLEIVSKKSEQNRLNYIRNYVNLLWFEKSKELQELLKQEWQ